MTDSGDESFVCLDMELGVFVLELWEFLLLWGSMLFSLKGVFLSMR
jgi:hypothetical protein